MSGSLADTLRAYRAERVPLAVFVPVAAALAVAGGGAERGWAAFAISTALAFGLVLQFRLWDDLADVEHDRIAHPDRVLVRLPDTAAVGRLLIVLGAVNASVVALIPGSPARLLVLAALTSLLAVWYPLRTRLRASVASHHIVLLKYPLIAYAAGTTDALPRDVLALRLALVYLAACIYEALHDGSVRAARGARAMLWLEIVLASILTVVMLLSSTSLRNVNIVVGGNAQ